MVEYTLEFIGRQLERLLANDEQRRDEMTVLTAMVARTEAKVDALEASIGLVLAEIRLMRNQSSRFDARLRKLEEA